MPDEKTLGLNEGEEKTPAGNGQPGKDASGHELDHEDIESDIDKILGDQDDSDEDVDDFEDEGDDTVVLPKKKLEQILRDKKNYKAGLLAVKNKIKGGKGGSSKTQEKPKDKTDGEAVMTKADFYKINSKKAIDFVCEKDPEIENNWAEIIKFYSPRRGKETAKGIVKDIRDAKTLWKKSQKKGDTAENKSAAADAGTDKGKPMGAKGGGKPKERKSILTKKVPIQDWYNK